MAKILIIEDDGDVAGMVQDWLEAEHHVVDWVSNGREGLDRLKFYPYELIILDWQLPDLTGIEILKGFRDLGGNAPVLMLTGMNTIANKEEGLDSGADDYLTKPFDLKELGARLRALLRRAASVPSKTFSKGDIMLDPVKRRVTKAGIELELLPKEFALLEFFLRHTDQVFSAEALLDRVWTSESESSPDTVRVTLQRLRKKIDNPGEDSIINTIHRVGYQIKSDN